MAKGNILYAHCATVGRNPKEILRSAVMVLVMSDDAAEVERTRKAYMARMGADEAKANDTILGGSVAQIQDKLGKLRDAGVGMLFIPTFFLPADKKKALTRVRRMRGQLDALERALEEGAECAPVLQQLAAIRGAVNGLMSEVLESHLREEFAHPASTPSQREAGIDAAVALVRSYLK